MRRNKNNQDQPQTGIEPLKEETVLEFVNLQTLKAQNEERVLNLQKEEIAKTHELNLRHLEARERDRESHRIFIQKESHRNRWLIGMFFFGFCTLIITALYLNKGELIEQILHYTLAVIAGGGGLSLYQRKGNKT